MKYYWINIALSFVFALVAVIDISNGRSWESLMWFFNAAWSISLVIILQNDERNDKLDDIKKLVEDIKNKDK